MSKYHTGELNNLLFNDVQVITDGYTTLLPNVVFFIVKLLSAFIYLVIIDKVFALAFGGRGVCVPVYPYVSQDLKAFAQAGPANGGQDPLLYARDHQQPAGD